MIIGIICLILGIVLIWMSGGGLLLLVPGILFTVAGGVICVIFRRLEKERRRLSKNA
ncbi:TPA: hypothetical protein QCO65_005284 [Bacillus cereus]|nr:hypothetical protein [Bacillus cereus]HDR7613677.1 hypothetical protein [Bacillus mycoides]